MWSIKSQVSAVLLVAAVTVGCGDGRPGEPTAAPALNYSNGPTDLKRALVESRVY